VASSRIAKTLKDGEKARIDRFQTAIKREGTEGGRKGAVSKVNESKSAGSAEGHQECHNKEQRRKQPYGLSSDKGSGQGGKGLVRIHKAKSRLRIITEEVGGIARNGSITPEKQSRCGDERQKRATLLERGGRARTKE